MNAPTCLFTGESLNEGTREEHTILRSLGGRIRSREVSSSAFNEKCGGCVDEFLKDVYAPLIIRLGPLLAAENQPGDLAVTIPGENGTFVLESGGPLSRRGMEIVEREPATGRPKKAGAADRKPLDRLAKQLGKGQPTTYATVPVSNTPIAELQVPLIGAEIEIAALKCTLLTFDHLLCGSPNRFTRTQWLTEAREFVRASIETREIDGNGLNRFSLGLQYEKLAEYAVLRERLPIQESPFEHVMFAAGSLPERAIDVVWVVFGFDPFGFRVSYTYDGPPFCFGFVQPIVKGLPPSRLIELQSFDSLLCRPSHRRAFPEMLVTEKEGHRTIAEIGPRRADAAARAIVLIERQCDDYVVTNLKEADQLSPCYPNKVASLFISRLRSLYGPRRDSKEVVETVEKIMVDKLAYCANVAATQDVASVESNNAWPYWLGIYRHCLDQCIPRLARISHRPGHDEWIWAD